MRRVVLPLAVILLVAAGVRLLLWDRFAHIELHHDERDYNALAVNLVRHGEFSLEAGTPISTRPPLYPALLAGVYRVFGSENYQAVRLVQAVLSLLTVLLLYRLAWDVFASNRVALSAAALYALYPSLLGFNNLLMTETLFVFLLCASCCLLAHSMRRSSLAWLGVASVVLGLAALTRSVLWLFPAPLTVLLLLAWRGGIGQRAVAVLVMVAAFTATLAPWAVRNTRLEHTLTIVDSMGGRNLRMGNFEHTPLYRSWDAVSHTGDKTWAHDLRLRFPPTAWSTAGRLDKLAGREGARFIREHPALTAKRDLVKFCQFWGLERELIAGASRGYFGSIATPELLLLTVVIFGAYALAAVLAVFGIVTATPADRRARWLLLLVVVFIWGVHTVVFAHSRYHLPAMALLLPFSAAGLARAREIWNRRGTRSWWVACFASTLLVAVWLWEIIVVDRERFFTMVLSA